MLNKFKFEGFVVKCSSFNEIKASDKGFFNISLEDTKYIQEKSSDHEKHNVAISFNVELKGYSGDRIDDPQEEDIAFTGEITMSTFFSFEDKVPASDEFMSENMWFFDNFNQISTKLAVESIIKNSNLSFLPIPWNSN